MVTPHLPWKFHANRFSRFVVILLTKITKKQRKKETKIHINKQRNRSKQYNVPQSIGDGVINLKKTSKVPTIFREVRINRTIRSLTTSTGRGRRVTWRVTWPSTSTNHVVCHLLTTPLSQPLHCRVIVGKMRSAWYHLRRLVPAAAIQDSYKATLGNVYPSVNRVAYLPIWKGRGTQWVHFRWRFSKVSKN